MERYSLVLVTAPGQEPITRGEAKAHMRVDISDDDAYIDLLITASRQAVENFTNRALCRQSVRLYLDAFPDRIVLPRPPLLELQRIQYLDATGVQQTLGSGVYRVTRGREPAEITLDYDQSWPSTRAVPEAVWCDYWAGYTPYESVSPTDDAYNVPEALKQAQKLIIGHLYENRENVLVGPGAQAIKIPQGAQWLMMPFVVWDARLTS